MAKVYAVAKGRVPGIYTSWAECEAQVKGFTGAKYKSFTSQQDAERFIDDNGGDRIPSPATNTVQQTAVSNRIPDGKVKDAAEDVVLAVNESLSADRARLKAKAHEYLDFLSDNGLISKAVYDKAASEVDFNITAKELSWRQMAARGNKPYPDHVDVYVDGSYNADTDEYGYGIYMDNGEQKMMYYGRGQCEAGGRNVEGETAAAKKAISLVQLNPHYKSVTVYHDYEGIGKWADKAWKANKTYTSAYSRFVDRARNSGLDVSFVHVDGHTGNEGNEIVDKLAKIGCGMRLSPADERFLSKYQSVQGYPDDLSMPQIDEPNSYSLMGDYLF